MNIAQSKTMTNTPMTFEEWYAQHDSLAEYSAKQAWEASEANQQAEMDALKYDLDGYMKIAHASATEIVQQEKTIVKLVRALKEVISANPTIVFDKPEAFKYVSSIEKARQAIAEAEGK